jgi:uncharacterized protein (TIGR02246 family)
MNDKGAQVRHEEQTATASRPAPAEDAIAAIRRVVAEAEKQQSDTDRFLALHTPDVVLVNFGGRRVFGKDALRQAMEQALQTPMARVFTKQEVEDVRFVRPDVAIVSCVKYISDEREASSKADLGVSLPEKGSLTYVLVREQDAWRIASAQTTPITYPSPPRSGRTHAG